MTNSVVGCTESIVATSTNILVGGEPQPSPSVTLDTPAKAFEHILASLARLEARIEASEQREAIAQPPPRPEPDPPDSDWQRGREDTATGVSLHPQLGFGDGPASRSIFHANPNGNSPWDRYGGYGGGQFSRGLHQTSPWDRANPTGQLPWDRDREGGVGIGQSSHEPHHASPWDRDGPSGFGSRSRLHTAWDNQALRQENRSGRPAWDGEWGRLEGGGYSDTSRVDHVRFEQPRYDTPCLDQVRFEQPRYEKMKPMCFDGSDTVYWISRVPEVVGGDLPNRVVSDDERVQESHDRKMVSLAKTDENLPSSLLNVTSLKDSLSAAERARAIVERRAADNDDEISEIQLAIAAARAELSKESSVEKVSAAIAASQAASTNARAAKGAPVELDEFGRDVNLQKRMDITRRSEARKRRRVKADSKRKLAMERDSSDQLIEGEFSTDVSDSESSAHKSTHNKSLQVAAKIFSDAAEEYSQFQVVVGKFEKWKKDYATSYRDAYMSLSIPAIFSPYVRLELLKWDPLHEYADFMDMKWYALHTLFSVCYFFAME